MKVNQSKISCRLNIHELFYNTNSSNQCSRKIPRIQRWVHTESDKLAAPLSANRTSQILQDWFGYFLVSFSTSPQSLYGRAFGFEYKGLGFESSLGYYFLSLLSESFSPILTYPLMPFHFMNLRIRIVGFSFIHSSMIKKFFFCSVCFVQTMIWCVKLIIV